MISSVCFTTPKLLEALAYGLAREGDEYSRSWNHGIFSGEPNSRRSGLALRSRSCWVVLRRKAVFI